MRIRSTSPDFFRVIRGFVRVVRGPVPRLCYTIPIMKAKDREALFQTFFESSPDAIFIEDMRGNVLDCNPAAAALHRMSREEIVGKNVADLVPPERRRDLVISATTAPSEFEGFSLTSDGRSIPVSIRTSLIEYLGQRAMLLHVRDITERKRFERE